VTHDDEDLSFFLAALEGLSSPPPGVRAGIRLAAAVRDLAALTVTSNATPDVMKTAERSIRSVIERLGPAGPSSAQTSVERAGASGRYMNHPFYGPVNPAAVPMAICFDGGISARASYGVVSEGRLGQVHPGCLAAGVLSLISLTAVSNGRWGRIRSVDVSYHAPALLRTELVYRVVIEEDGDGFSRLSATVRCENQLLVEASAVVSM
jgi:hypothetical protein